VRRCQRDDVNVTHFYLIRHAEKSDAATLLSGRLPGVSLSPRGVRQAQALAGSLAHEAIKHLFSSPLERARETAETIGREKKLSVRVCDSFNEYDFGAWSGRHYPELEHDVRWRNFNAHRSTVSPPEGETMLAVQARFVGGLLRLTSELPDESVAIVSHCEPIRCALLYCLGMSLDQWQRIEVAVASVSVIAISNEGPRVLRLNEVARNSPS
jgi:broad specificity phosphatase PhoE